MTLVTKYITPAFCVCYFVLARFLLHLIKLFCLYLYFISMLNLSNIMIVIYIKNIVAVIFVSKQAPYLCPPGNKWSLFAITQSPYRGRWATMQYLIRIRCYVRKSPPCSKAPVSLYILSKREHNFTFSRAGFLLYHLSRDDSGFFCCTKNKTLSSPHTKKAVVVLSVYVSIYA